MSATGEDRAALRFAIISIVRLGGIGALLTGIAVLAGALDWPLIAGLVLLAAGAAGAFLAPTLLARRWSSKRHQ